MVRGPRFTVTRSLSDSLPSQPPNLNHIDPTKCLLRKSFGVRRFTRSKEFYKFKIVPFFSFSNISVYKPYMTYYSDDYVIILHLLTMLQL